MSLYRISLKVFNFLKLLKITKNIVYGIIKLLHELNTKNEKPRSKRPYETRTNSSQSCTKNSQESTSHVKHHGSRN